LQYKPNIENLQQMSSDGEGSDESESDKEDKKPGVFRAAKLNPVLYEDKDTKRQRREML
jgi:hypothetical protein